ncbi:uncharacterized [Tachysurus ichikawai]
MQIRSYSRWPAAPEINADSVANYQNVSDSNSGAASDGDRHETPILMPAGAAWLYPPSVPVNQHQSSRNSRRSAHALHDRLSRRKLHH